MHCSVCWEECFETHWCITWLLWGSKLLCYNRLDYCSCTTSCQNQIHWQDSICWETEVCGNNLSTNLQLQNLLYVHAQRFTGKALKRSNSVAIGKHTRDIIHTISLFSYCRYTKHVGSLIRQCRYTVLIIQFTTCTLNCETESAEGWISIQCVYSCNTYHLSLLHTHGSDICVAAVHRQPTRIYCYN